MKVGQSSPTVTLSTKSLTLSLATSVGMSSSNSIFIIPIGIAYSQVPPKIRSKVSLCFGEPLLVNKSSNLTIKGFNEILHKRMQNAENIALENVGR